MEVGQKPFTQKKPRQLVYLELGSGNGGMLLSIAEDGFRFRAVSPVRADGLMPFAFSLDGVNRLEGSGEIESLEDDGKSGGLRFTEVSGEFRSKLTKWLSLDSPEHSTGREVTPVATTTLDTMEKIRQDIRAGSSVPPRQSQPAAPESMNAPAPLPAARLDAGKKPAPSTPVLRIPERVVADRTVKDKPVAQPPPVEQVNPNRNLKPIFTEHLPETKEEPDSASKLFTHPLPSAPEAEKPAALASAFLKLAREARKPAGAPVAPVAQVGWVPPTPRIHPAVNAPPALPPAVIAPGDAPVAEQPRRYVPALDVSLDMAWENAKLSTPAEPPHLSRAAAGGIITIALAVILGALGFNFRQEIGAAFIQMGQRISGGQSANVPAQDAIESQPNEGPDRSQNSQPLESQPQSTPATSGSTGKPFSAPAKANAANPAPASGANSGKTDGATGTRPSGMATDGAQVAGLATAPAKTKPQENSAVQSTTAPNSVAVDSKAGTSIDSGTGQEDFDAAREILHGIDRAQELPRAVELLWAAVKKGNVAAEVTLGDLYRRGDGVEKSCDQARVLLVAASKKGSADARKQLEQMAELGCG